jgi:hypothetical protein
MKKVPLYRWIVDSDTPPGRRIKTRHAMSEEEAHARGRNPVRIDPPVMWIDVPETPEEQSVGLKGPAGRKG